MFMEHRFGRRHIIWHKLVQQWFLLLVFVCPVLGQGVAGESTARVLVTSDPTGQFVTLDNMVLETTTPVELNLDPGKYFLMVNAEGYQSLSHDFRVTIGQQLELDFILLETPPEPPAAEKLRYSVIPTYDSDEGFSYEEDEPDWDDEKIAGSSCIACHPLIPPIHYEGLHRTISCDECHGTYEEHVKTDKTVVPMQVMRGQGMQMLCLACHEEGKRAESDVPIKTIAFPEHLQQLKVGTTQNCNQCHHVHAPMKWVFEARDMVGVVNEAEIVSNVPLLNEKAAEVTRRKFNSMAEIFLVTPLAPGIFGEIAFSDDRDYPADELIIAGLVLSVGSYVLGKIFYARQLEEIRSINSDRQAENFRASEHNKMVERALADHAEAFMMWDEASEGRGVVIVRDN